MSEPDERLTTRRVSWIAASTASAALKVLLQKHKTATLFDMLDAAQRIAPSEQKKTREGLVHALTTYVGAYEPKSGPAGHDRAIADAQHAIKLDPELAMAHVNLGHALGGKGDATLAAQSYRRGLDLNPDPEVAEEALKALERLGVRRDADDEDAGGE